MGGARSILFALALGFTMAAFPAQTTWTPLFDLVTVPGGLRVMRHEVTQAQWQLCVKEAGCSDLPQPPAGVAGGNYPVTGVGILDAQEFVAWARTKTGQDLRLPTLAEWYRFSGVAPSRPNEIFTDPRMAWAATYGTGARMDPTLKASGGFGANALRLSDVTGNVWEWTSSCVMANAGDRCPAYFAAGEHEAKIPLFIRDPATGGCATGTPPAHLGLRLVVEGGE